MANKQLTATVRLNTSQAETKIRQLDAKLRTLNNATNNIGRGHSNVSNKLTGIVAQTKKWTSALHSTNSIFGSIGSKLKGIASTYLGIMGAKAIIGLSDTITSAENKLNYVSAQQLGSAGVTEDGSAYTPATYQMTQEAMDKMYVSAQKVRMSYTDMMSNVSKSMALAGDAFGNSTDNAIRFQEVMAEAYAVGGASAQEMHSSMYQMMQALGAGILAGDELRSVREGAPLAYQAIEKFAQGVYDCEDSLKDMASQGKITSEMVVAAILDAEGAAKTMDEAFQKTEMTFAQAWIKIKNMATYTFTSVSKELRKMLNEFNKADGFKKLENAIINIAKGLLITLKIFQIFIGWVSDNWNWLSKVIIGGLTTILTYLLIMKTIDFVKEILELTTVGWAVLFIALAVGVAIAAFYAWKTGAIDTLDFILWCLVAVGIAIIGVGLLMGNVVVAAVGGIIICVAWAMLQIKKYSTDLVDFIYKAAIWLGIALIVIGGMVAMVTGNWVLGLVLMIIGLLIYLIGWFVKFADQICGYGMALGAALVAIFHNCIEWIKGAWFGCGAWIKTLFTNLGNWFVTLGSAIGRVFDALCNNIGAWFTNCWDNARINFWNFIADCLEGLDWLAKPLEAIAKLFGSDFNYESFTASVREKGAFDESKRAKYIDISDAWNNEWGYYQWEDLTDAYSNAYDEKYLDVSDMWDAGYQIGADFGKGIQDKVNGWGDKLKLDKDKKKDGSWLDEIGEKLGLDLSKIGLPDPDELKNQLVPYDMPSNDELLKSAGDTADNTGKMADAMELRDEDLEYFRKIAEMEWRNEFTTAEIKVDMTNHNTVNGDRDLDGIVEYLSDVLREEMTSVAYGVHY